MNRLCLKRKEEQFPKLIWPHMFCYSGPVYSANLYITVTLLFLKGGRYRQV